MVEHGGQLWPEGQGVGEGKVAPEGRAVCSYSSLGWVSTFEAREVMLRSKTWTW